VLPYITIINSCSYFSPIRGDGNREQGVGKGGGVGDTSFSLARTQITYIHITYTHAPVFG
jgi:hypothetical protein